MLPFISFFGITIPTYGLCMLSAYVIMGIITYIRAKKTGISFDKVLVFVSMVLAGAILFGSLLHTFVTYPISYITDSISRLDFSFLTSGGLVFYGGLIGGVIGALVSKYIIRFDIWQLEKIVVPLLPLGQAIGRVGCLLSGCCYGIEYTGPFAITYPDSIFNLSPNVSYFPVQLLEAVLNILIFLLLVLYSKKERARADLLFAYVFLYGIIRFGIEFLRGDTVRGVLLGFSTSQWISLAFILLFVLRLLYMKKKTS